MSVYVLSASGVHPQFVLCHAVLMTSDSPLALAEYAERALKVPQDWWTDKSADVGHGWYIMDRIAGFDLEIREFNLNEAPEDPPFFWLDDPRDWQLRDEEGVGAG